MLVPAEHGMGLDVPKSPHALGLDGGASGGAVSPGIPDDRAPWVSPAERGG